MTKKCEYELEGFCTIKIENSNNTCKFAVIVSGDSELEKCTVKESDLVE